ncbi:MAG: prephenate dehydrogenase/arogenate dehydrogenase family protein [Chloroflexi bacterium]|nr:prephenate dehydrogenase/arogenate dehydrogenase family protein [Chloroflexota bacterium]
MASTRITLVGCEPIGTLLGLALKAVNKNFEVVAHDKKREAAREALKLKAADREEWNLPKACAGAAIVFVTTPPDQVELTLQSIGPDLMPGATVCVVGGSNVVNLALADKHLPESVAFVSSSLVLHPVLIDAPHDAAKLKGAMWSLVGRGSAEHLGGFAGFVEALGARPLFVDARERDGMALSVDVLPQILAGLLMATVSKDAAWRERGWAAGADFAAATAGTTNAAALVDALLADKKASSHWLNQFMRECMALRDAIEAEDGDAAKNQLAAAAERRERWLDDWRAGRDSGAVPIESQGRSMLGMFVGQRMADMFGGRPSGDKGRK